MTEVKGMTLDLRVLNSRRRMVGLAPYSMSEYARLYRKAQKQLKENGRVTIPKHGKS